MSYTVYAFSAILAPVLPVFLLMVWTSYREERGLARLKSLKGFWPVTLMYASAGIGLLLLTLVVYGIVISPFI